MTADRDDPRRGQPGRSGDRAQLWRVRLFVVVLLTSLVVAAVETVEVGGAAWVLAPVALLLGAGAGVVASRSSGGWAGVARTLVPRLAAVGLAVLVLYAVLALLQERLSSLWAHAPLVAPVVLAALAGVCLGVVAGVPQGLLRLAESVVGGPPRPRPPR